MNGWEDTASWWPPLSATSTCWTSSTRLFALKSPTAYMLTVWSGRSSNILSSTATIPTAKLGIPQSSFSKKIKLLKEYGFIDRFIAEGNKKEIFIRPTEKAIRFYKQNSADNVSKDFLPFFEKLDRFSDGEIDAFTEALELLTDTCEAREQQPQKLKYIKLD